MTAARITTSVRSKATNALADSGRRLEGLPTAHYGPLHSRTLFGLSSSPLELFPLCVPREFALAVSRARNGALRSDRSAETAAEVAWHRPSLVGRVPTRSLHR